MSRPCKPNDDFTKKVYSKILIDYLYETLEVQVNDIDDNNDYVFYGIFIASSCHLLSFISGCDFCYISKNKNKDYNYNKIEDKIKKVDNLGPIEDGQQDN